MTTVSGAKPYTRLYPELAQRFDLNRPFTDLHPSGCALDVHTYPFASRGEIHSVADYDGKSSTFRALISFFLENNPFSRKHFFRELESADRDIVENREFRYSIFAPKIDAAPAGHASARPIILLHGLNEKSWDKYLPWAARLAEETDRPVILFPIAFHMNRAPEAWANPREMMGVAKERRRLFPELRTGSFANAALSHRIQFAPQRFVTSGLESYFNIVDLVRDIHEGRHPMFPPGTRVDLFGYSIGASLSELFLMANRDGLFSDSRAFLFCGGSILDKANPVSKAIMDEEAHRGLQSFLAAFARDPASALGVEPSDVTLDRRGGETVGLAEVPERDRPLADAVTGLTGIEVPTRQEALDPLSNRARSAIGPERFDAIPRSTAEFTAGVERRLGVEFPGPGDVTAPARDRTEAIVGEDRLDTLPSSTGAFARDVESATGVNLPSQGAVVGTAQGAVIEGVETAGDINDRFSAPGAGFGTIDPDRAEQPDQGGSGIRGAAVAGVAAPEPTTSSRRGNTSGTIASL